MKKILLSALVCSSLFAFDTRTHVFIAQEVINDLEDGTLTIAPYGEFEVDVSIKEAILSNKDVYRMGNIGADGFPDVIAGQVTLHPGLEDGYIDDEEDTLVHGWKSDEWFKYVLSKASTPKEIAFAYGYIGHGTSDTFAHTYVNMYTGDIFDMNDGETDVEKRHIALEKYISDRLPPLKDSSGTTIGRAYEVVAIDDALPVEFLKNTLIMNDDVSTQYQLSSTASYLSKMYKFREDVKALGEKYAPSNWNPFKDSDEDSFTFTQAWVKKIDSAIDEYIKMSSRMSKEFLRVTDNSPEEPLMRWINCYANAFTDPTTILSSTSSAICEAQEEVELDNKTYLFSLSDSTLLEKLKSLPIFSEADDMKSDIGYKLVDALNIAILDIVLEKNKKVSADSLNELFASDDSDKNLLLIGDIAQRIDAEMKVDKGILDPNEFRVLYNAITLTKLSLLKEDALNTLLIRAGVSDKLSFVKSNELFNVTFNAIKTIDGNHQWLEVSPPYPRANGNIDALWPESRVYGYEHTASSGFALYNDIDVRKQVFNKIFKGVLSLGLETPKVIGFSTLLDSNYPYITCSNNPFPEGTSDKACLEFSEDTNSSVDDSDDDDSSETTQTESSWYDELLAEIDTYFDDATQAWLDALLADLYAYGDELVKSVTSIIEDDGSTTVEVVTEISDEGITF